MIKIPTTTELFNSIVQDIEGELSITIPVFGKAWVYAFAAVQTAKLKLFYLSVGKLQKNIFVDTADSEASGGTLERFGRVKLGRNPLPATQGVYIVTVTGIIGGVIKALTVFKSNDDSSNPAKLYILDEDVTLSATSQNITLRALTSGVAGKLVINDTLNATIPIANVDQLVTVFSESTSPTDAEDIEDYRQSVIDSFRIEPQGGASSDYRLWTESANGLRKIYPYTKDGYANEIEIFVEANAVDSIGGHGAASSTLLTEVEALVEFDPDTTKPLLERGRRPLGVFNIDYNSVTPLPVVLTISNFSNSTTEKRTLIFNAIKAELDNVRPFISGSDVLADKNDIVDQNKLILAILTAVPGAIFTNVSFTVDGTAQSTYTFERSEIPYLSNILYV